ncbi:PQQ-binding-like beta-propeller repeat protein, partial [Planctomycetota bacterium]
LVWAAFNNGVAVCYDMDGNQKWVTIIEKCPNGWGPSASPLLIGNLLIVNFNNLVALDADTGKEKWRAKTGFSWGTSGYINIGGTDILITPKSHFIRVSDGKILGGGRICNLTYNGPTILDGKAYFIQNGGKAVEIPKQAGDKMNPKVLWTTSPKKDRYYASPLVHNGLVYAITQKNVFSVINADDGKIVYSKTLDLGKGAAYPSITLGGKYVYVSQENGTTIVLEHGKEYKEAAKNKLEAFRSSPVFIGTKMYLRTRNYLYCIGK